jgi:hypothetical protein
MFNNRSVWQPLLPTGQTMTEVKATRIRLYMIILADGKKRRIGTIVAITNERCETGWRLQHGMNPLE